MTYAVSILRRAQNELSDLRQAAYERVRDAIRALAENPRPHGANRATSQAHWRREHKN